MSQSNRSKTHCEHGVTLTLICTTCQGEARQEAEHLRDHIHDGRWHDGCIYCERRRVDGGTGVKGTADRLADVTSTVTIPCPKCGQRVYEWALPSRCPGCGTAMLRAEHTVLRPMVGSFVLKYGWRSQVVEFDGAMSGETVRECDHDHETEDEAMACGRAFIAEHKGK